MKSEQNGAFFRAIKMVTTSQVPWLARLIGFTLVLMTSLGRAESSRAKVGISEYDDEVLHVSWRSNSTCGDARRVFELVREMLGESMAQTQKAQAKFDATSDGSGFHVVLEFSAGVRTGRRTFDVESCEAVLDASTIVLAVALQPNLKWETALNRLAEVRGKNSQIPSAIATAVLPDVDVEPIAPLPIMSPSPIVDSSREREPPPPLTVTNPVETSDHSPGKKTVVPSSTWQDARIHVVFGSLLDSATLPSWTVGAKAGAGIEISPVSIFFQGVMLTPKEVSLPGDVTRGVKVQLTGGEMQICSASRTSNVTFAARPCVGALLAAMSGEALGFSARRQNETYFASTWGGDTTLRIRRGFSITSGIAVVVPLRRVSVVVDGVPSAIHRTQTALQAWFGVDWVP